MGFMHEKHPRNKPSMANEEAVILPSIANLRSTKPESGFGIEKAPNSVRAPGSHTWYRICNGFLLSGMQQLVNLYIAEI
jgi:hypothetical protein